MASVTTDSRRWIRRLTSLVLASALATGCSTAPLSFIEGVPFNRVLPDNHYPLRVVSVDGSIQFHMPVQVTAGPHMLVLEAAPSGSARGTTQRTYALKIAPCTRYVLLASRTGPMAADWELVIHSKEPVTPCNAEEELKKTSAVATMADVEW